MYSVATAPVLNQPGATSIAAVLLLLAAAVIIAEETSSAAQARLLHHDIEQCALLPEADLSLEPSQN